MASGEEVAGGEAVAGVRIRPGKGGCVAGGALRS